MAPQLELLKKYASGRKYQHALQWYSHDFSKYKANYIFPGRDSKTMFCQVTKLTLNKIPSEIESHLQGKRYQQALKQYEAKLERTKAANARRDAKVREAAEKGWEVRSTKKSEEKSDDDEERVDLNALGQIAQPQQRKKAWFDDLSDLNPGLSRGDRGSSLESEPLDKSHPLMAFIQDTDAPSDRKSKKSKTMDVDEDSDSEEAPKPSKSSKKASEKTEKKEKADKGEKKEKKSRRSGEKKKSELAESVEEELKPKYKSMKASSKDKKEKREKKRSKSE